MKKFALLLYDFLVAVISAYVLATLAHSQFVLHELIALGVEVDLDTRISMSLDDLAGLLPAYGSTIALSLLIGFIVTALLRHFRPALSDWLYTLAGACGIFAALMAMHPILDITLIAGARTPLGIFVQALAGAFGGWAFMYQRRKHRS